ARFFIGLTILNQNPESAHVRLRSILDDGTTVAQVSVTLNPFASMTRSFNDFLSDDQIDGFIYISSDVPIFASALESSTDNTLLANLPAMHSRPEYSPPTPFQFRIKGAVRRSGIGVGGVKVRLSGPINLSPVTNQAGAY